MLALSKIKFSLDKNVVKTSKILQGSTLSIIETDTVYNGIYFIRISNGKESKSFKVIIDK